MQAWDVPSEIPHEIFIIPATKIMPWISTQVADKIAAHIPNGTIQEMVHKLQ